MLWESLQALFRSCGDPEVMPYDIKWSQFDATYEYCKSAVVFFCFQAPLSQHIQTHLHHTVEVVLNAWNNQTLHISPWRFQNHQALFLKPCLQHRWAQQCADTIISYSKPWTTAIFSHPDRGRGGEERGGESKAKAHLAHFIIYLHQREVCLISRWWGLLLWGVRCGVVMTALLDPV